jgi:hypothetical protein
MNWQHEAIAHLQSVIELIERHAPATTVDCGHIKTIFDLAIGTRCVHCNSVYRDGKWHLRRKTPAMVNELQGVKIQLLSNYPLSTAYGLHLGATEDV